MRTRELAIAESARQETSQSQCAMHVTVCICTYRRPELLRRLLEALRHQVTGDSFSFSLVVTDNDASLSARSVVDGCAARSGLDVVYCTEPRRNIAHARNRAVEHARGDFVAWIDDDEFPTADWLRALVAAVRRYDADGVLGPVRPHFDAPPPRWLIEGRFCERPEYATGTVMQWHRSFAGNSLLRLDILRRYGAPFRAEFGRGGEDVDFFKRMAALGHTFVWCNEAVVHEIVPPIRWTRSYRLKRALLLGRSSLLLGGKRALARSLVAVPVYLLVLPCAALFGQHIFLKYGIKLSSHLGLVLAWFGFNPVKERPE